MTSFNFDDGWTDIAQGALAIEAKPALWFFGSSVSCTASLSIDLPEFVPIGYGRHLSGGSESLEMVGRNE